MRKGTAVLILALLVVPILAAPAHAWEHGGFHHGGGCGFSGFVPGLGIGVLATAPRRPPIRDRTPAWRSVRAAG